MDDLTRDFATHGERLNDGPRLYTGPSIGSGMVEGAAKNLIGRRLEPTGGLRADLDRVCAEAVAGVAGRHLVCGSRPLADRSRREQT